MGNVAHRKTFVRLPNSVRNYLKREQDRWHVLKKARDGAAETRPEPARPSLGLLVHEANARPGYTFLAPTNSTQTDLIDMQGRVVQTWKSDCNPGLVAYLLDNGNLLRTGQIRNPPFFGGGTGGRIQEFTWDGRLVWEHARHGASLSGRRRPWRQRLRLRPPGGGGQFRAPRYGAAHAGLIGKGLKQGKTVEEILETNLAKQARQR